MRPLAAAAIAGAAVLVGLAAPACLTTEGLTEGVDGGAAPGVDVTTPPDGDAAHVPAAALLVPHAAAFCLAEAIEPLYLRVPDAKVAA